jgi:hypothetical protein
MHEMHAGIAFFNPRDSLVLQDRGIRRHNRGLAQSIAERGGRGTRTTPCSLRNSIPATKATSNSTVIPFSLQSAT